MILPLSFSVFSFSITKVFDLTRRGGLGLVSLAASERAIRGLLIRAGWCSCLRRRLLVGAVVVAKPTLKATAGCRGAGVRSVAGFDWEYAMRGDEYKSKL